MFIKYANHHFHGDIEKMVFEINVCCTVFDWLSNCEDNKIKTDLDERKVQELE